MKWLRGKKETSTTVPPVVLSKESQVASGESLPAKAALLQSLSESARVELYRIGDVKPVKAGDDLSERAARSRNLWLLIDTEIDISLHEKGVVSHLLLAKGCLSLASLPESLALSLTAKQSGTLISLTPEQRSQLSDELMLFISSLVEAQIGIQQGQLLVNAGRSTARMLASSQHILAEYRDQLALVQSSEVVQAILAKIPRLPVSSAKLLNRLLDETSSRASVAEMVGQDPALTATLLKAINSPLYAFEQKISDVNRAIGLLGFDAVYQIIMAESLRKSLPDTPVFRETYAEALDVSYIAFAVATACGKGNPSEMSTLALMHNLGEVVAELMERQSGVVKLIGTTINTDILGAGLIQSWNLPESLWLTTAEQHFPAFAPLDRTSESCRYQVAILYLSVALYQQFIQDKGACSGFMRHILQLLDIKEASLKLFWDQQVVPQLKRRKSALPAALKSHFSD